VALDYGLSIVPTKEWQDNLSKRLAYGTSQKMCPPDDISVPAMQKRRLNNNNNKQRDWDSLYKIEPTPGILFCGHLLIILAYEFTEDDLQSTFEGMGQLSLDENQEASIFSV
jgi:hypothetical protein